MYPISILSEVPVQYSSSDSNTKGCSAGISEKALENGSIGIESRGVVEGGRWQSKSSDCRAKTFFSMRFDSSIFDGVDEELEPSHYGGLKLML